MNKLFEIKDFAFQNGSILPAVQVAYQDINPKATKTTLIITCFRGRLGSTLNFKDGALRNHRIIVVALFGNGESSSPSNTSNFPSAVDYRDCVNAQHQLITSHLDISSIDVIVGFSMGGQCAYYWTLLHPNMIGKAVIICSSAKTSRHNFQFLEGPKAALENSIDYGINGSNRSCSRPVKGLRAFGKAYSAWLTSAEWFEEELYKSQGYESLQAWDHEVAGTNYDNWHPDDLLAKIHMWQAGDVTVLDASAQPRLANVLSRIEAPVLLMPCRTDQYFRWEASEIESKLIPNAVLKVIPSSWGHLAGLGINKEDRDWMDKAMTEFLMQV